MTKAPPMHFLLPDALHPTWRLETAPEKVLLVGALLREAVEANPLAGWRMVGSAAISFETPTGLVIYDLGPVTLRGEREGWLRHD
jgi:hypothetical protein